MTIAVDLGRKATKTNKQTNKQIYLCRLKYIVFSLYLSQMAIIR